MKRFKIGFLAIIAVVAMSFTVADNAGVFKAKFAPINKCLKDFSVRQTCTSSEVAFATQTSPCPASLAGQKLWVESISPLNSYTYSGVEPVECRDIEQFCCITVEVDPNPCRDAQGNIIQPQFNLDNTSAKPYRVVSSYCQPLQ